MARNELRSYANTDLSYDQMADMVTNPGDSLTVKMTKRGRSTKVIKGSDSLTRLELKNCDRYYMTKKK